MTSFFTSSSSSSSSFFLSSYAFNPFFFSLPKLPFPPFFSLFSFFLSFFLSSFLSFFLFYILIFLLFFLLDLIKQSYIPFLFIFKKSLSFILSSFFPISFLISQVLFPFHNTWSPFGFYDHWFCFFHFMWTSFGSKPKQTPVAAMKHSLFLFISNRFIFLFIAAKSY